MPAGRVRIRIPYGSSALSAEAPRDGVVFRGDLEELPELEDFEAALRAQLDAPIGAPPLRDLAAGRRRVLILVDDNTRQTPADRMLPVLLACLNAAGVRDDAVEILIAPGTHRAMTGAEVLAKVGAEVRGRVAVSQHDCMDASSMVDLEPVRVGGVEIPVQVNRKVVDADLVIGLGAILPHCGAGFSGGAKILQPGVCGLSTTSATHVAATRLLPRVLLGDAGSPVRACIEEVARRAGLGLIVNVVCDPRGRLTAVVAGDCVAAHRAGAVVARRAWGVAVPRRADIVVVSSHPADIDWWQAEKALVAASLALRPGGVVVFAAPCPEGLAHNHPKLRDWLALSFAEGLARVKAADPADVAADLVAADLAVFNAMLRETATILAVGDGLNDGDAELLGYRRMADLQQAVGAALRIVPGGTIGVLPYGGGCLPLPA